MSEGNQQLEAPCYHPQTSAPNSNIWRVPIDLSQSQLSSCSLSLMPLAYRWGKLCWITTLHLGGNVLDIWMTLLWKIAWKYIGNQSFFSIWMSVFLVHHAISCRWLAILILIIRTRPAYVFSWMDSVAELSHPLWVHPAWLQYWNKGI